MVKKTIISKFNSQGSVRFSVTESKTLGLGGAKPSVAPYCSPDDDPFVTYAYDEQWSVKLQRNVHIPVFECGYVE